MKIIKKPTDPIATRISLGGIGGQNYCVYRGTRQEVMDILMEAIREVGNIEYEPAIDHSEFGGI